MLDVTSLGIKNNGKVDNSTLLSEIIEKNPKRSLYFPEGTYLFESPIYLPTTNSKSVNLIMDDYAILKAGAEMDFLIKFKAPADGETYNFYIPYSRPHIKGGIINCNKMCSGIKTAGYPVELDGIEIQRAAAYGMFLAAGYNSTSSDVDIHDCVISGIDQKSSSGIKIIGSDNKISNCHIQGFRRGMDIDAGGIYCHNIHTLHHGTFDDDYPNDSVGFLVRSGFHEFHHCYADTHASGWVFKSQGASKLSNCTAYWWKDVEYPTYGIRVMDSLPFNSHVDHFTCYPKGTAGTRYVMRGGGKGQGIVENVITDRSKITDISLDQGLNGVYDKIQREFNSFAVQTAKNTDKAFSIVFTKKFLSAPIVTATPISPSAIVDFRITKVSSSGFSGIIKTASAANVKINWSADNLR